MEINEFIGKFAGVFDDTDVSMLHPETKFRELEEWSSLSALGLIAMVDEEYDIELNGDDVRKAETISDIFGIIKQRINE